MMLLIPIPSSSPEWLIMARCNTKIKPTLHEWFIHLTKKNILLNVSYLLQYIFYKIYIIVYNKMAKKIARKAWGLSLKREL